MPEELDLTPTDSVTLADEMYFQIVSEATGDTTPFVGSGHLTAFAER
jgi:hypothetical protein